MMRALLLAVALSAAAPAAAQAELSDRPVAVAAAFSPALTQTWTSVAGRAGYSYGGGVEVASRRFSGAVGVAAFDDRDVRPAWSATGTVYLGGGRRGGTTTNALSLTAQRVRASYDEGYTLVSPAYSVSRRVSRSGSLEVAPQVTAGVAFATGEAFRRVGAQAVGSAGVALGFGRGATRVAVTPAVGGALSPEAAGLSFGVSVGVLSGFGR